MLRYVNVIMWQTSEQGSVQSMMNCDSEDNMVHQGIFVG